MFRPKSLSNVNHCFLLYSSRPIHLYHEQVLLVPPYLWEPRVASIFFGLALLAILFC